MMILGKELVSNAHHQRGTNLITSQLLNLPLHRCSSISIKAFFQFELQRCNGTFRSSITKP